jgi:hypothetical protein
MDSRFLRLLRTLSEIRFQLPADLPAFLKSLPAPSTLPSPWLTWMMIGLFRHRERQAWVKSVVIHRLQADIEAISSRGYSGHPSHLKPTGTVPGLPEWDYDFHGIGCRLSHKVSGEEIDVDFRGDSAEYFDEYFYSNYLKSLRLPEPPEQRLLSLYPSTRPIRLAFEALREAGILIPFSEQSQNAVRLTDELMRFESVIESVCRSWKDPANTVWLAATIGDWPAADDAAAGSPEVQQITAPLAQQCRLIRRNQLLRVTGHSTADALFGLVEVDGGRAELVSALQGSPTSVMSAAMQIIETQEDSTWLPLIHATFLRLNPAGSPPEPHIWMSALKLLLEKGFEKSEVCRRLPEADGGQIGEAVLLSLEHAPEYATPLIRRGLLSHVPQSRLTVAATLSVIAKPWSIREMLSILNSCEEEEMTAEVRAALTELCDTEIDKAVQAWEHANPHEIEPGTYFEEDGRVHGPFHSMAEHMLRSIPSFVRYEMASLHDRVTKLRNVDPKMT